MNDLIQTNAEAFRASTDAAGLCREIVVKTAKAIQGRKYVGVEGWQSIAIARGCTASAFDVERVTDEGMMGFRATGVVRRMIDGQEIARAEGFVGDDEKTWANRPVYARRAMVQTRAISRACRSAFAHVVVMIDAGLSTTPAEEVPAEGFDHGNVIEGARIAPPINLHSITPTADSHPVVNANRPAPLEGIIKTRKALKERYEEVVAEIRGAADVDALSAYIATPDVDAFLKQIREIDYDKNRVMWDGMDGFPGMSAEIANAYRALQDDQDQGDEGDALVRTVMAG